MPTDSVQSSTFDALMNAAVDAIIVIDQKGTIIRFNQAAQRLFGYNAEEVTGKNVKMLMPEPQRTHHDHYLERYRKTRVPGIIGVGRETTGLKSDGVIFPMQLSVGEIKSETTPQYVGIIRDLSEQQLAKEQVHQLEEQLLHADRLVILGELTAGIAHEINQPLTAIAAYADAGKQMATPESPFSIEDISQIFGRIGEQSRRAGEVVQRLRKLVRTGTISKSSHDLNQIIRNILLLFDYEINKSNINLDFYPLNGLKHLYLDEIQVQQILVNLVKNSLDAISESSQPEGTIEIRVTRQDAEVEVSVIDNGPGVPEDLHHRVFESFFTTKPKGVGLGLSICKSIAAAHGGNLRFTSPTNGGSSFVLTLPLESIG